MTTNVILATWHDASKAYEVLAELKNQPELQIVQAAVLVRKEDGSFAVPAGGNSNTAWGALNGGAIGALVGILGGPLGVLLGYAGGAIFGSIVDAKHAVNDASVMAQMSTFVVPGRTALVAEVNESSTAFVDDLLTRSDAHFTRVPLDEVKAEIAFAEAAANAAAVEASKVLVEQKKAQTVASLEAKWDELKAKFKSIFN